MAQTPIKWNNALPVFKFKLPKSVVPVMPPTPVDEETLEILAIVQKRVDAETHKRAEAEALIREAAWGARTLAEAQKLAQPLPLTDEQQSQAWKDFLMKTGAQKLLLKDQEEREHQAQQEREKRTEEERKMKAEKDLSDLIRALHKKESINRHADVKHVAPVAPVAEVPPVKTVKPVRVRTFNKLIVD